ncbi:MAG: PfaD family polyunsaturated fatty acid/polyketide biosynthesis protein [Desulfobacteraceae bacterium]|nr:PfaD family polyunsaturated fatty acid/polyketide biosynthesis protein [Desulfobacteraceae bacterium]
MPSQDSSGNIQGWWYPDQKEPLSDNLSFQEALHQVTRPIYVVSHNGRTAIAQDGTITLGSIRPDSPSGLPLLGYAPALHPQNLGDPAFKKAYNLKYPYVAGAMANGITSVEMVAEVGQAGMIGFFGAAGLLPDQIEAAITTLKHRMGSLPFGFNLIHSPTDPELESATVDLYLRNQVKLVSASAYLGLTLPLVYYRVHNLNRDSSGNVVCPNKIIAKVSRVEVARKFLEPPPEKYLRQLIERNLISEDQAALAAEIPMADDLTAEADSGGHTDNRPALTLLPTMLALRDELSFRNGYRTPVRVGLAGGIATPHSTAAAFAMGAAYVLTGSVNQSCVEAGTSDTVRQMLAEADQADVSMAPAADMFELGVKVQVLKRGTMFPLRAGKLYELYNRYNSYEEIPSEQRAILERDFFRSSFEDEWEQTKSFFAQRDPRQIELAEEKPKHKMALVFRSYLGRSSNWANAGDQTRKIDYQIWCGPAIGAFNHWVKGSFLEKWQNRKTVTVAMNLMLGAALITRVSWLRQQGISLPTGVERYYPLKLSEILQLLDEGI